MTSLERSVATSGSCAVTLTVIIEFLLSTCTLMLSRIAFAICSCSLVSAEGSSDE